MLVHPRGSEPSAELQSALAKHRISIRRASSAFDALAQVCTLTRTSRTVILLLAHPTKLDAPDALYAAAQRYAPKASCWVFDSLGSPRLRAATAEDAKGWSPHPASRLVTQPKAKDPSVAGVMFTGPGFPRTPLVPEPPSRVEPKPAAPPAPTPVLKLAGNTPTAERPVAAEPKQNTIKEAPAPKPVVTGPKFVGGSWDGGTGPFPGTTPGTTPRQLLTDEELAMLLADPPTHPHT